MGPSPTRRSGCTVANGEAPVQPARRSRPRRASPAPRMRTGATWTVKTFAAGGRQGRAAKVFHPALAERGRGPLPMKLFIDSANLAHIKEIAAWGILDGVT